MTVDDDLVILYVVPNCPLCENARVWLRAMTLTFEERDVANSYSARRQMFRLTRQGSVPVVVYRGKALVRPRQQELHALVSGS